MSRALIVGHTGQDGAYLSRLLTEKGYAVMGLSRAGLVEDLAAAAVPCSVEAYNDVSSVIQSRQPSEVYYLAAVHQSSADARSAEGSLLQRSLDINVKALVHFLEAIRLHSPRTRLFYAASSHIFGDPLSDPQNEDTPLNPVCIYGISKTAGVHACHYYRDVHGVFASVGIFYNHESPLRDSRYVSQKIVRSAIAIKLGIEKELVLGSLESRIDWGYAPDYVDAAWRVLQLAKPGDYVISSGESHTVREFVEGVFDNLGLDWQRYVKLNPALITKKPKERLRGDIRKITGATGWFPATGFNELIRLLTEAEMVRRGIQ
jgi:GDPmannose 4,6-dehydratase